MMEDNKETEDKITKAQVLQLILLTIASIFYFLAVF